MFDGEEDLGLEEDCEEDLWIENCVLVCWVVEGGGKEKTYREEDVPS